METICFYLKEIKVQIPPGLCLPSNVFCNLVLGDIKFSIPPSDIMFFLKLVMMLIEHREHDVASLDRNHIY